jgi:hypothetical protein
VRLRVSAAVVGDEVISFSRVSAYLYLEPVGHDLTVGDGVHDLDRLHFRMGSADVPSHRHAAWELQESLFISVWESRSLEVLDKSSHVYSESP